MKEVWRDIKGYEGYYQVSNLGRVKALERATLVNIAGRRGVPKSGEMWKRQGRILKPIQVRGKTTSYVHLHKEGQPRKNASIKRLVAEAFLPEFTSDMATHSIILIDKTKDASIDNIYIKH